MANDQHYESAEDAAEGAREHLAPQYAPLGEEPRIYTVEVCGLKVVCLPWAYSKRTLALRSISKDMSDFQAGVRLMEARFTDTLWWIQGQREPGRKGAREHARALADLGGKYGSLPGEIVTACGEQDEEKQPGK